MLGQTTICKWKDDKVAAFTIGADDSLDSQLDFMIPEMLKRGFAATFWVNPGRRSWYERKEEWLNAARNGCDFGNHTIHHQGAKTYEEAEREIRESAENIWTSNLGQRLQLFDRGGGTTWLISDEEITEILTKYDCVEGRGTGYPELMAWHEETDSSASAEELGGYVDLAIREGSWQCVALHGVGPKGEWLTTDAEPFIALLDYLVDKQDVVWVGTNTQLHKYDQERRSARIVTLEASDQAIRLNLTSDKDARLYEYPLTLRTEVPSDWTVCSVTQGNNTVTSKVTDGVVQFEAIPGFGEISIRNY